MRGVCWCSLCVVCCVLFVVCCVLWVICCLLADNELSVFVLRCSLFVG